MKLIKRTYRKLLIFFLFAMPLLATGQTSSDIKWKAKKVFEFDKDNVYNLYIDTIDGTDKKVEFCFQTTTGELVKTDNTGKIQKIVNNPYTYFTLFQGDTLILNGTYITDEKGYILSVLDNDNCRYSYIAASTSKIYVQHLFELFGSWIGNIFTIANGSVSGNLSAMTSFSDYSLTGLCCSKKALFAVICSQDKKGTLLYGIEGDKNFLYRDDIPVIAPAGVAEYEGFLYVFSNSDKALYRLETPEGMGLTALTFEAEEEENKDYLDTIYPLNMDFIPAPNKMFVKKVPGVTNDYIVSLLDEQFNDKYHITGWYGDFCKVDVVEDSLIDGAITELLKSDSVAITRRILYFRPDYEFFIEHGYPIDEYCEICVFNGVTYHIRRGYTQNTVDSLANVYGLTNTPDKDSHGAYGSLSAPKTADIFDIAQKLYDTQCFTYISLEMHMRVKYNDTTPIRKIETEQVEILETQYYNLSGQRINTPSGLTIVVTRYSDGSVSTEKRLFR